MSEITSEDTNPAAWRAEYAYTAGVQAFIYGFPYIYNARVRLDWVTKKRDPEVVPYAAVNHFWHAARLLDASYRDAAVRAPIRCIRWRGCTSAGGRSSCSIRTWGSVTSPSNSPSPGSALALVWTSRPNQTL
jgi:hypothetical protein